MEIVQENGRLSECRIDELEDYPVPVTKTSPNHNPLRTQQHPQLARCVFAVFYPVEVKQAAIARALKWAQPRRNL